MPSIKPIHISFIINSTTSQGHYLLTQQMTSSPTSSLRKRARTSQTNCYSYALKLQPHLHQCWQPHQFYPPDSIAGCSELLGNCDRAPVPAPARVTRYIYTSRNHPGKAPHKSPIVKLDRGQTFYRQQFRIKHAQYQPQISA
ncbi:hypothetical protein Nepgr_014830 [Nepenthes gracilis]|uniref:Uncharacterized protein n=1 Tax=Nepenthes gracilis TaxID=150966 RepID=A0AAD3XQI5_NEPGR|nr:hypothetical protein Nepgr_014830 [Nepenthes gracilis]